MARVKRAVNAQKKRRAILEQASGYRGQRSRLYRKAKEQVTHSLVYNYNDRKKRKGDFRQLWIQRINAAARANGMTYNRFIQGLKAANIEVPAKMMEEHQKDVEHFTKLKGSEFDKEFAKHQVTDHEKGIALFTRASKEAKDAGIKDFATKTLPTLKEHLDEARKLDKTLGGGQ